MSRMRKHAGTLLFEPALIGGGFAAEKMLPQIPGWGWLTYSIVAGIVSIPLIYGPEMKAWWSNLKRLGPSAPEPIPPEKTITEHGVLRMGPSGYPEELIPWEDLKQGRLAAPPAGTSPSESHTTAVPMHGIPVLERCHQALVKYMAIPAQRPMSNGEIAGSAELYPYMAELCGNLDEQDISHPKIDYGITIVNTRVWARFLGDLRAVRHDIDQARCVDQGIRAHEPPRARRPGPWSDSSIESRRQE